MKKKTLLAIIIEVLTITPIIILAVLLNRQNSVPTVARQLPLDLLEANPDWVPPPEATPLILIFYSPECDHCQNEAKKLSAHPEFQEQTIYWLSGDTPVANQAFWETYATKVPKSFHFLEDADYQIANTLGVSIFPTIFIYDTAGDLLRRYEGETEPEEIINWLA